jgi:hypothetical protein
MVQVQWNRCNEDKWCKLNAVDLTHKAFDTAFGIYVIWHKGNAPKILKVGQGNIKERITKFRNDKDIQKYDPLGLYVTWANVSKSEIHGIETYVGTMLKPLINNGFPNVPAIEVNLPFPKIWGLKDL